MKTEIEQARESIKEYRKGYGQSQLSTDCIIQLMILHTKKQLVDNEDTKEDNIFQLIREHLKKIWMLTKIFKCSSDVQLEISMIRQILRKAELSNFEIQHTSKLLFCPYCGNKRELIVETDINSSRICKSGLCTGK